jgi:CheY-like chemotaxis protein
MTKPLVMLFFEKLLPGSQLIHRLEDLGYRVQSVGEPGHLLSEAEATKPLLIIADVEPRHQTVCKVITDLRTNKNTSHIPVVAIAGDRNAQAQQAARQAGANLVVTDNAILQHLAQFLAQALEV